MASSDVKFPLSIAVRMVGSASLHVWMISFNISLALGSSSSGLVKESISVARLMLSRIETNSLGKVETPVDLGLICRSPTDEPRGLVAVAGGADLKVKGGSSFLLGGNGIPVFLNSKWVCTNKGTSGLLAKESAQYCTNSKARSRTLSFV
jgi:hypothetical protein